MTQLQLVVLIADTVVELHLYKLPKTSPQHLDQLKPSFYKTKVLTTEEEAMEVKLYTRNQAEGAMHDGRREEE